MFYKSLAYFLLLITNSCDIYVKNRQYNVLKSTTPFRTIPGLYKYQLNQGDVEKTKFQLLSQIWEKICLISLITMTFITPNFLPWLWSMASKLRAHFNILIVPPEGKYENKDYFINVWTNIVFIFLLFMWCRMLYLISTWLPKKLLAHYNYWHDASTVTTTSRYSKVFYSLFFIIVNIFILSNVVCQIINYETKVTTVVFIGLYAIFGVLIIGLVLYITRSIISFFPKKNVRELKDEDPKLYQDLKELFNNSNYGFKNNICDIYITEPSAVEEQMVELRGRPLQDKKLYLAGNMFKKCCDTNETKKREQIYALVLLELTKKGRRGGYIFYTFMVPIILIIIGLLVFFVISLLVSNHYESILASFGFIFENNDQRYSIYNMGMKHYPQLGIFGYSLILSYPLIRMWLVSVYWIKNKKFRCDMMEVVNQGCGEELYDALLNYEFNGEHDDTTYPDDKVNLLLTMDHFYICYYGTYTIESYLFLNNLLNTRPEANEK
ncbi:uncharacterized protein SCDLUD_003859 [Saccharomycodes ludwigii]|uniref:uncharacterized protein n=1 Tax=Saccharomycodes ludwigii TaxID=36035 RepID=UPI001E81F886|nr:hypothetical protein SCDLUD_003859 [Saccharomycodes ludwigii]KAH3899579.1 hypothetical protein SCDLUD_003859 [Saccharomycodes ludwigii]